MKRSLVFILLLVSSLPYKGFACYFYPYGEDIRYSIFNPENFRYNGFRIYNYTSTFFYDENYTTNLNHVTENDLMWYNHCQKRIPITEIKQAIFEIDISQVSPNSKNRFIQYLYQKKDYQTINYLLFAKEVEKLNPQSDDLWENNTDVKDKLRDIKIEEAYKRIKTVKNTTIKKRYYYQIFKLLSYMGKSERTITLYDSYTKLFKATDFLDDWALFYRMNAEPDNVKMNYLAAQVFARGTDNKFDIKWYFNKNIPIDNVLKFARNDEEKANIHVLYSFRRIDQNLENIIKVHQYDAKNPGLSFLLLREINKLEDWILTPTYTMYLPTLREDYWENSNGERILNRVEVDRLYASKLLQFVNSVNINIVDDKEFWLLSKSYLEFLTKDYPNALKTINSFENKIKDEKVKRQCDIVKALVLTANQVKGKATILKSVESVITNEYHQKNDAFLFGIAKELEILGDRVDAAFLISKIKEGIEGDGGIYFKSRSNKITLFDDFYYDWYGYIDAELSTTDLQTLVNTIHGKQLSSFDQWKISDLQRESNKVNDLMGIKYMRDDNLKLAYHYFSKVDKNHYTNAPLFNESPFYRIKGYMSFNPSKSAVHLTKAKVVHTLMKLKEKVNRGQYSTKNQDCFLIANCYYNMSYYGNSWMMKRITQTANRDNNYDDDIEYYRCHKAKEYYQKAEQNSNSKKFKALCMYMISKCDAREKEYFLLKQYEKYYYVEREQLQKVNREAFSNFKTKYPSEYDEMMSNCEVFSVYFNAR
ncbi:hypothetical protein [Flavobacterium terrisoli]|uniref:hypothetical protein n=1 Tax=Flavobacterium terrisoli TaxID=3242195 RepID=UPI0025433298|nr:hypothetical protein [Flavobacterium buctense]